MAAKEALSEALSEAAFSELMEQCEDQFTQLEKVMSPRAVLYTMGPEEKKRYKLQSVSLCCSFRMRSYCLNQMHVRILKTR